jgi:hypothetical protein
VFCGLIVSLYFTVYFAISSQALCDRIAHIRSTTFDRLVLIIFGVKVIGSCSPDVLGSEWALAFVGAEFVSHRTSFIRIIWWIDWMPPPHGRWATGLEGWDKTVYLHVFSAQWALREPWNLTNKILVFGACADVVV